MKRWFVSSTNSVKGLSPSFFYSGVCNEVNQHYHNIWIVIMEKLRHDYFNSPWATVSTIAAIVLLFLTIVQIIALVITLLSPPLFSSSMLATI